MVSRTHLTVSYLALLSSWIVGFALARMWDWQFGFLNWNPNDFFVLFGLGLALIAFSSLFFGRLGFLVFLVLGAVQGSYTTPDWFLLNVFQGLVLAWFGTTGIIIGEQLFEDLKEEQPFQLLNKQLGVFFLMGILLAIVVTLATGALHTVGTNAIEVGTKIRNRELSMDDLFELFVPADFNEQAYEQRRTSPLDAT